MYRIALSLLILAIGAVLAAGGVWLAFLGGSWFYILIGLMIAVSGGLMLARNPGGLVVYGAALLVTLFWSIWEVGLDWWALAPRGGLLIVLALLILLPPMVRALYLPGELRGRYGAHSLALAASVVLAAAAGIVAMFQDPHGIEGAFPQDRMAAVAGEADADAVPPGEWHRYGRTHAGQRFSPLDQITPQNVANLDVAWTYQTGEVRRDTDPGETTYQVTPLVVGDMMFICTPFGTVIALDPVTGDERWRFDPHLRQPPTETTQHMTCRGVSYHRANPDDLPAGEPPVAAEAPAETAPDDATGETAAPDDAAGEPAAPVIAQEQPEAPADEAAETAASETQPSPQDAITSSVGRVTTQAAPVPQNIVTSQASPDDPFPHVTREVPPTSVTLSEQCMERLFTPTSDGRLISISARTGEICPGFGGADGTVNLWANMPNITPGSYYSTSPPLVTERLIIVGGAVNDNTSTATPSGVIRAYDVYTGALVWNFDSKNPDALEPIPDEETYSPNAPNSWSISSYDPGLGLLYLPMANEAPDQYGVERGENTERFSSSVLALQVETGEVAWIFKTVHHDLWDYDVPAQPSLIDLTIDGQRVPALVQPTKQGDIFVLNRETGEPIIPVEERPAPQQGAVEGERVAPTQPASALSFRPQPLREADMWGATPFDQLYCRIRYRQLEYGGTYTPPSLKGTLHYPGNFGTFNWGGVAVDPGREMMFGMPVYLAFTVQLIPREDEMSRVVTEEGEPIFNENFGAPYAVEIGPFYSPLNLPCQRPPWGYVAGADLRTGEIVYRHVNGTVRDLSGPIPLPFKMGVPGIGGPIVTAGGVAFLSGTVDYYVRGYDLSTGAEIWRSRLPAGGQATPSTYLGRDGRQYLVVVAGGHGSVGTTAGDSIIAYAFPDGG